MTYFANEKYNQEQNLISFLILDLYVYKWIHVYMYMVIAFYLHEWQNYREEEGHRMILPYTGSLLRWLWWLEMGLAQTRNPEFLKVPPGECRGPGTCTFFSCFPRNISWEGDQRWSSQDCNPCNMWAASAVDGRWTCKATIAVPTLEFLTHSPR